MAMKQEPRTTNADVPDLAPEQRALVEQMLIDGATFEDVVEAVNKRGGPGVSLTAVQNFFRSNLELQKQRIRRQVEDFEKLKAALGNPDTAEARLAAATLFSGYMRLYRKDAEITPKDAERARLQRENLRLRQRILWMKERSERDKHSWNQVRVRHEQAKLEKLRGEMRELRQSLKESLQTHKLSPEALRKIQEIYGLITEPFVPKEVSDALPQR